MQTRTQITCAVCLEQGIEGLRSGGCVYVFLSTWRQQGQISYSGGDEHRVSIQIKESWVSEGLTGRWLGARI